jgi:hypothetical protein
MDVTNRYAIANLRDTDDVQTVTNWSVKVRKKIPILFVT